MKRLTVLSSTALFVLTSVAAFGQSKPIVTSGWISGADGAHATVHVVKHSDGSITGSGQWLYADPANNLYISVDQAVIGADGKSAYLSGNLYGDAFGGAVPRYVLKLIDNGEGSKASGPDSESYIIYSFSPTWDLSNPFALFLLDTPSFWGLSDWFPLAAGNIQVHKD